MDGVCYDARIASSALGFAFKQAPQHTAYVCEDVRDPSLKICLITLPSPHHAEHTTALLRVET